MNLMYSCRIIHIKPYLAIFAATIRLIYHKAVNVVEYEDLIIYYLYERRIAKYGGAQSYF